VNPNTTHTQISDLRRKAAQRRQDEGRIPSGRLRSATLALLELCELSAAGLTPMSTPLPVQERVNGLTRDRQYTYRPAQKDVPFQADRAIG